MYLIYNPSAIAITVSNEPEESPSLFLTFTIKKGTDVELGRRQSKMGMNARVIAKDWPLGLKGYDR